MNEAAIKTWQDKIELLLVEEAKAVDGAAKFKVQQDIAEARAKLDELSGHSTDSYDYVRVAPTKLRHTAGQLVGREEAIARLDGVWSEGRIKVVVIRAWGGVGKTSLVAEWMARMAALEWRGARWAFDWTFYSQGTRAEGDGDKAVSADLFITEALAFFGDPDPQAGSPWYRGARLAGLVAAERGLLVLDGVEPLQHPPGPLAGQVSDPALLALLKGLAQKNAGLCLVTTREPVVDLAAFSATVVELAKAQASEEKSVIAGVPQGSPATGLKSGGFGVAGVAGRKTVLEWPLDSLSDEAGGELLHGLGVTRAGAKTIEPHDQELRAASREVRGHALTLQLMGNYLRLALDGDIRQRAVFKFAEADQEFRTNQTDLTRPYGHAFSVIAAYERWFLDGTAQRTEDERLSCKRQLAMLRLLGLFNRPADAGCLQALRQPPAIAGLTDELVGLDEREWKITAQRLEDLGLVKREPATGTTFSLDAHPLVREYFSTRMKDSAGWREAHARLFDHLCKATECQPATVAGLQPLYQAIAHGCLAGRQQEACDNVYFQRIRRGNEDFSKRKLGAFGSELGAIASFFERPWSRVSPALADADQAWLLNEAAFTLRALGRLTEAVEPMRATLVINVADEQWQNASVVASNLSQLELTLGWVSYAVSSAEQSVAYADRSGDEFQRLVSRSTEADTLHQAGRRSDAQVLFRDAESLQAARQTAHPLLYSVQGFQYCNLLLADVERAAWQRPHAPRSTGEPDVLAATLDAVEQRVTTTLGWMSDDPKAPVLTIALDHLTLSRAALYRAILMNVELGVRNSESNNVDRSLLPISQSGLQYLAAAVNGLRSAAQQQYIPLGLLTRAWNLFVTGDYTGARADLDETWEIAERGPMPLFQADIHLTRARLFGRTKDDGEEMPYPWESVEHDLQEARRLIDKHGYHRRDGELADAEAAFLPRPEERLTSGR